MVRKKTVRNQNSKILSLNKTKIKAKKSLGPRRATILLHPFFPNYKLFHDKPVMDGFSVFIWNVQSPYTR